MKKICLLLLTVLVLAAGTIAQVAVTVTNPTNTTPNLAASYTSLANAITALDAITAISGPVTLTCAAGSETAPAGGYAINFTAATTLANNVVITGTTTTTITASSSLSAGALNDAIFKIIGSDYVTIQNFTMQEGLSNGTTNAATNNMTEWGVALLYASTTNGAQNNSIKNNIISLSNTYTNSFGIYSNVRHSATSVTVTADITNSTTAPNSGNKVYNNTINNVNMGIAFIGSATALYQDTGNDIGGSSTATANTITFWGGAGAATAYVSNSPTSYCIYMNHQTGDNVSYNTIGSATISGSSVVFRGIFKDYSTTAPVGTFTSSINGNTIAMFSANTSGIFECISSQGMTALSTATININFNTILNCTLSGASTSSSLVCINNTSVPGALSISNNIMRSNTSTATTGGFTGITNTGDAISSININNNQIGNIGGGAITMSAATSSIVTGITNSGSAPTININNNSIQGISVVTVGAFRGIFNGSATGSAININNNHLGTATSDLVTFSASYGGLLEGINNVGGPSACVLTIQGNDFRGIVHSVAATAQHTYINSGGASATVNVLANTFTNLAVNTTGSVIFILRAVPGAVETENCNNNSIVTAFNKTGSGGTVYFLNSLGSYKNGSVVTQTGNNFSNVTVIGTTSIFGWYNIGGQSATDGPTNTITGNTFNNITAGTGTVIIMEIDKSAATNCSSNTISNINGSSTMTGIYLAPNNGQGTFTCSSNTISNLSSPTAVLAIINGFNSVPVLNMDNNNISGLSCTTSGIFAIGLEVDGGISVNVSNNVINNLSSSNTAASTIYGILVQGGTTVNIFKNKVYNFNISGTLSAVTPLIYGMDISTGVTTVTAYNNFISDLKAPNVSGSEAIRGIYINSTTVAASYNLYYNSIYLNAASTGTDFGTTGIYHRTSTTATTAALNMSDNIIANTSTANGTGVTVAYRRSDATLTNYGATSNYNLFYAGAPSATNLIYYDGTNADQTLAAYKTRVSTRDANSISVLPNFTSATDLHLMTDANCGIDGKGNNNGILLATDYDGDTRSTSNPFITDIGADEFTGSFVLTVTNPAAVCFPNTVDLTAAAVTAGSSVTSNGVTATLGYYEDAAATIPILPAHGTAAAINTGGTYYIKLTKGSCSVIMPVVVTINASNLTGATGGAQVCVSAAVLAAGSYYTNGPCSLIARVVPSGGSPVSGTINTCVIIESSVKTFNAEPYVQRHYDIEPATSPNTATATITLYFKDAEFVNFNTASAGFPHLPTVATGGNADVTNIAHLRVTQYHGVPIAPHNTGNPAPGFYSLNGGNGLLITPTTVNYNSTYGYWEVSFPVTGFSGFYVHTNLFFALPVSINYFRGTRQGTNHILDWKVTCNTTPKLTMTLERSDNATGPFAGINVISATAAQCNQPFGYTDAQPLKSMNYYRLKMVDADGKISYSGIVALLNAVKGFDIINIAPNPVTSNGAFKLNLASAQAGKMDIMISDMTGRIVLSQTISLIAGYNSIDMNVSTLAAGTYNISGISPDEKTRVIRFVKQ
jgi:hypothetical protein